MDTLEHAPITKQQIKDTLYQYIYAPVTNQFKARIETLILRNTLAGGYAHKHFVYKGTVYNAETTPPPMKKNRLVAALKDDMEIYLKDLDLLNNQELPFVLGYINHVLNASNSIEDYIRAFPEPLHQPLKKLQATCPCRAHRLTEERIASITKANETPITLIKRRLVSNLII